MVFPDQIAHDLAVAYARTKLETLLNSGFRFDDFPASAEIEELAYLEDMYGFALSYYGEEPSAWGNLIRKFRENPDPPRPDRREE